MFVDTSSSLVPSLEVGVPATVGAVVTGHIDSMLSPESVDDTKLKMGNQNWESETSQLQLETVSDQHDVSEISDSYITNYYIISRLVF